jgi:hypothetical protein
MDRRIIKWTAIITALVFFLTTFGFVLYVLLVGY